MNEQNNSATTPEAAATQAADSTATQAGQIVKFPAGGAQGDGGSVALSPTYHLPTTYNQVVNDTVHDYLDAIMSSGTRPTPQQIEADLLRQICDDLGDLNTLRPKGSKFQIPRVLPPAAIAHIVKALYPVCKIPCAGKETDPAYDVVGLYQDSGPDAGLYATSDLVFRRLLRQYNFTASERDFREFMVALAEIVERREPCRDRDLIAVNNGIFDYKNKKLSPFSPDYIFLSKSRVDYRLAPMNPVIHNPDDNTDWDVESWMGSLSDDPEITDLLWKILGAIIRPNVSWNKAAFFYSETGNNGKGTLCALMRNLCGPGTYCSISLADFGKEFQLEPLMRASAIIVDENSVGAFADKSGNFKAAITGDVLYINRKNEKPISIRFRGLMVQCVNELPRVKDKSDSLYRRLLLVPFTKCFTGHERKYIKDDYLNRPDVLEYVLWRVLNMDYYELPNPAACQALMGEYKQTNDPLRQFADEILPQLVWDAVPLKYMHDLYTGWLKQAYPGGHPLGKQTFNTSLQQLLTEYPDWTYNKGQVYIGNRMNKPEPLSLQYNLTFWQNQNLCFNDRDRARPVAPALKDKYTGVYLRVGGSAQSVAALPQPYVPKTA